MGKSTATSTSSQGKVESQNPNPDTFGDQQPDAASASATTEGSGKRRLVYDGFFSETRILTAADFNRINEGSDRKKTTWSEENNFTVDVTDWPESDIQAVLTQPKFKLVED